MFYFDRIRVAIHQFYASLHLKVPKHENFILVDFRDFFTKQTPWDSDPVDMILKIICNGQALMYRV